jgi:hypothetical protein
VEYWLAPAEFFEHRKQIGLYVAKYLLVRHDQNYIFAQSTPDPVESRGNERQRPLKTGFPVSGLLRTRRGD